MKHIWSYIAIASILVCMLLPSAAVAAEREEYIVGWGSFAPAGSESVHSYGIAMDASGNVYVNDPENDRVRTYEFSDLPLVTEATLREVSPDRETETMGITSLRSNAWIVGPGEDDDFAAIQDAIDAATDGDTILIKSGIYRENVLVDKALVLVGSYDVIVDEYICLAADGCTLIGCVAVRGLLINSDYNTLEGVLTGYPPINGLIGGEGITVYGSHNTFINCAVDGFWLGGGGIGMTIEGAAGNTFIRCPIIDSYNGIIIRDSDNNVFRNCAIWTRSDGVILENSDSNTFSNCAIDVNMYTHSNAITLLDSNRNIFTNCRFFGTQYGVFLGPNIEYNSFTGCTVDGMSADWYPAILVDEFPVEGGAIIVAACSILGVVSVFMRRNDPK